MTDSESRSLQRCTRTIASPPSPPTIVSATSASRRKTRSRNKRVLQLIGHAPVFDGALPEARLEHEPRLLEHAARCRIPRERERIDTRQTVRLDGVTRES